eukprot:GHVL01004781.1.p1 GENE.GHVL01004781.1~~GHVL01004781.1.p1  ORF type:complete len:282 (+),score=58.23 GHVL01004781.1:281-1126(+)
MFCTERIFDAMFKIPTKSHQNEPLGSHQNERTGAAIDEAKAMHKEDLANNLRLGDFGVKAVLEAVSKFFSDGISKENPLGIIHHCNTGHLATAGHGTALGVIYSLSKKFPIHVYVDETRPRLQGSRLTCWELKQMSIPHSLIVDGASGLLMYQNRIHVALFGADRVAVNGDVANKIGTYNLVLACHAHNIPAFCCCPTSTIDINISDGFKIPIEIRDSNEVTHLPLGSAISVAPLDTEVLNFAFDITPNRYLTGIITNVGTLYPPFQQKLKYAKIHNRLTE